MSDDDRRQTARPPPRRLRAASIRRSPPPSAASSLLLLLGSLYSRSFLSPEYLLQQLKVASFLGVIATGMMLVILLGQIDLSVPWVVAVGGMMACGRGGLRRRSARSLAIPVRHRSAASLLGLVNGFGVAYLRIPSMIITLAINAVAQGLMVVYTGGFSPQDSASPAMRFLATGDIVLGIPNAVIVWAVVGAARGVPADAHDLRPRRLRASATASAPPISRASTRSAS